MARRGVGALRNNVSATGAKTTATPDSEHPASVVAGNSRQVELIISLALRCGVLASSALVLLGSAMLLLPFQRALGDNKLSFALQPGGTPGLGTYRSLSEVLIGLSRHDPSAVIALGLLVLIVTPIVPIVLSAASFLQARDKPYILITVLVLGILAVSFFLGATT